MMIGISRSSYSMYLVEANSERCGTEDGNAMEGKIKKNVGRAIRTLAILLFAIIVYAIPSCAARKRISFCSSLPQHA